MDCDLARRLIPFNRAHASELDSDEVEALNRHLAECSNCSTAARIDRDFDSSLARAMQALPIPDHFPARLHTRLLAARMAIYRRWAMRGLLVLCLGVAGWAGWSTWRRPVLDPTGLANQAYEWSGASRSNDEARDLATAWLRTIDPQLQAPDEFNYELFLFPSRSDLQGLRSVPTLVFARRNANMRVYAVRENAFKDLSAFRDPVEASGSTVEARRYESMPGWVFVVVTSGAPPEQFRRPAGQLVPA